MSFVRERYLRPRSAVDVCMFQNLFPPVLSFVRSTHHGDLGLVLARNGWLCMVWYPHKESYYFTLNKFELVRGWSGRKNEDMSAVIARIRESDLDPCKYRLVMVDDTGGDPYDRDLWGPNLTLVPLWHLDEQNNRLDNIGLYMHSHFYRGPVNASLYEPALEAWRNNKVLQVEVPYMDSDIESMSGASTPNNDEMESDSEPEDSEESD